MQSYNKTIKPHSAIRYSAYLLSPTSTQKFCSCLQQRSSHYNNRCGSVTGLNILRLGQLHQLHRTDNDQKALLRTPSQTIPHDFEHMTASCVTSTYHLCCGMEHFHLFQDGSAIIGDRHRAFTLLDHLVHTPRSETGPDGISNTYKRLILLFHSYSYRVKPTYSFQPGCWTVGYPSASACPYTRSWWMPLRRTFEVSSRLPC